MNDIGFGLDGKDAKIPKYKIHDYIRIQRSNKN